MGDTQESALNNVYSSLGSLSVESESKKRFMCFSCLRVFSMRNRCRVKAPRGWPILFPRLCHSLMLVFSPSTAWQVLCSEHLQRQLVEDGDLLKKLKCSLWRIQLITKHIWSLEEFYFTLFLGLSLEIFSGERRGQFTSIQLWVWVKIFKRFWIIWFSTTCL